MIQFYECFFVMSYLTNRYIFFPSNGFFSPEIIFALFKTHIHTTYSFNDYVQFRYFVSLILFSDFFIFSDLFSDIAYFDIKLLPRDDNGNILFPQIPKRLGIFIMITF